MQPMPDVSLTRAGGYPSLTGIRALAAAIVFVNHNGYLIGSTALGPVSREIRPISITGVILFFVLSGFLLSQPSTLRGGVRGFARRRVARIIPVYYLALTLSVGYLLVRNADDQRLSPLTLLANYLLLQSWSPLGQGSSINLPSWSLSIEALFYLVLPFLLRPVSKVITRYPAGSLIVLLVLTAAGSFATQLGWVTSTLPVAYLPIFFLGVHVSVTARAHIGLRPAIVVAVLTTLSYPLLRNDFVPAVGFMLLIAALADHERNGGTTWLGRGWLQRFGVWSYAFFLMHVLVIDTIGVLVGRAPRSLLVGTGTSVVAFVLSWVLAALVFTFWEEPARRLLSRRRVPAA